MDNIYPCVFVVPNLRFVSLSDVMLPYDEDLSFDGYDQKSLLKLLILS